MKRKRQTLRLLIAGIVLILPLLAGCASLDRNVQADASGALTVQDVWARADVSGQNSAVYLQIINESEIDDQLIAADSDVAAATEIHDVVSHDNVMKMEEIAAAPVPAGDRLTLEPGGFHVMLFDLQQDLVAGDEFEMTLIFAEAGDMPATVEVRDHTPGDGHGGS